MSTPHRPARGRAGFSLVEVVLALGVVGFAIVAILGVVPVGLSAGKGAQDESRAAQIAQGILAALSSQNFDAVSIPQYDANGTRTGSIALVLSSQTGAMTPPWAANNKGELLIPGQSKFLLSPPSKPPDTNAAYTVALSFNNSPAGFDPGYANFVTLTISWPATALAANQTRRSFMRIISKY